MEIIIPTVSIRDAVGVIVSIWILIFFFRKIIEIVEIVEITRDK